MIFLEKSNILLFYRNIEILILNSYSIILLNIKKNLDYSNITNSNIFKKFHNFLLNIADIHIIIIIFYSLLQFLI